MADDDDTEAVDPKYYDVLYHEDREFQQYAIEKRIYFAPNDELERERLQTMHDVLTSILDGKLVLPERLQGRQLNRVLDCGYGAGSFIVDLANHPEHAPNEIIGVDISPRLVPDMDMDLNVRFDLDDLNRRRLDYADNTFDLVNSRMLAGGIAADKWNRYCREILRVLRPGGWCQMVEIYFQAQSDGGHIHSHHALRRWSSNYIESQSRLGKDPRVAMRLASLLTAAGFTDVRGSSAQLPMCGWSRDDRMKAIGNLVEETQTIHDLLSSIALYPFTVERGMSREDFELLVAQARSEASTPALKPYFHLSWAVGRKHRH